MMAVDCRSDLDEVFRSQARALYRILNWLLLLVFGRSLARPDRRAWRVAFSETLQAQPRTCESRSRLKPGASRQTGGGAGQVQVHGGASCSASRLCLPSASPELHLVHTETDTLAHKPLANTGSAWARAAIFRSTLASFKEAKHEGV